MYKYIHSEKAQFYDADFFLCGENPRTIIGARGPGASLVCGDKPCYIVRLPAQTADAPGPRSPMIVFFRPKDVRVWIFCFFILTLDIIQLAVV